MNNSKECSGVNQNTDIGKVKYLRKSARRCVNGACIMYIIAFALQNLFYVGYNLLFPLIMELFSLAFSAVTGSGIVYSRLFAESIAGSAVTVHFISMLSLFLCVFLPFVFYSKCIQERSFDETAPMNGKILKGFIPAYAAAQLMASAAAAFTETTGSFIAPDLFASESSGAAGYAASNGFDLVVIFLSLCILTPFVEEYVFRGVIFGSLRKFGAGFAVVTSSLIFGLAHGSLSQMSYAFAFGIALALVFEKTGNLKTSIVFHFINNTLNYLLFVLMPFIADEAAANILAVVYNTACGVVAVIGIIIIFLNKKDGSEKVQKTEATAAENPSVGISCMFAPGMILLVAMFAGVIMLS